MGGRRKEEKGDSRAPGLSPIGKDEALQNLESKLLSEGFLLGGRRLAANQP